MDAVRDLSVVRTEVSDRDKDMAEAYEARLDDMRKQVECVRKDEVHTLEEATSAHIQVLVCRINT